MNKDKELCSLKLKEMRICKFVILWLVCQKNVIQTLKTIAMPVIKSSMLVLSVVLLMTDKDEKP